MFWKSNYINYVEPGLGAQVTLHFWWAKCLKWIEATWTVSTVQNVIFHSGHVCDPTATSETRPVIYLGTLILCYGRVLLFMLKTFGKIKCAWATPPPSLSSLFFICTSTNVDLHNHTGTYTQARHPSHVISLGIMPMAKHVTYQKSLWDIAREREREEGW